MRLLIVAAAVVALLGMSAPAPAHAFIELPGPSGWDDYRQLNRLPELHSAESTQQFASTDFTGRNNDFWDGPQRCLGMVLGQCVIAQHAGGGEVDAIWFTWHAGDVRSVGNLTIVLDGMPVVHAPLQDIVDGRLGGPFRYPLVANADQSSGGVYIAVPMPFRFSMLIMTDSSSFYYHVTYRAIDNPLATGTFLPVDAPDVVGMMAAAGTRDPKPPVPGAFTVDSAVQVAPRGTGVLADLHGAGSIAAIRIRVPASAAASSRIRISFDGVTTVDSPFGEFFGTGIGVAPVRSLMFAADPSGWYSAWWPMPYASQATVSLVNGSGMPITGEANVTAGPDPTAPEGLADGRIGHFHTMSHAGGTVPGQDWPYLQVRGPGKFVGNVVAMTGPGNRMYLEGNERIYVDGAPAPQINGTGTEDYYESGWYFNRGPYNSPLHGNPSHLAGGTDRTAAYRLWLAEAVPFHTGITVGIQHGPNDDVPATYSSTAFWYGP